MITPVIAPAIFDLRPDFVALSMTVVGARNTASDAHSTGLLRQACAQLDDMSWAEDHLEAWRDAYRAFGAKPQRTPSSADALRKRARRD